MNLEITGTPWARTLKERGNETVMNTYARYPIEIASGEGCRVTDSTGKSYLDFVAGIATNVLGHGHPHLVKSLHRAADGLLHVSNLYWTEPMVRLAERLCMLSGMEKVFFCNSGAEANEAALKMARKARPDRPKIVVFERSFHGRTYGALSATMQPAYQDPFRPLLPGFVGIPFGDAERASAEIDLTTAAVLVEPVQGEGGVRPAPEGFLAHLRRRCDEVGALLIFDEVQTGVGRTGLFYAYQRDGILPDALTTAKALAGGLPIGAMCARGEAGSVLGPGQHASTYGGGPFIASAAHAVLDVVTGPGFLASVSSRGEHFGSRLRRLVERHPNLVKEARGLGLMWGLQLSGQHAPALVEEGHALGLLTVPAGKDVLRLVPPLVITVDELDEGVAILDAACTRVAGRLQS